MRNFTFSEAASTLAAELNLLYVDASLPGITRKRKGKGFAYYDRNQVLIKDEAVLERIRKLAIPPAYESVWICPDEKGHIQAIGLDVKQRKQYIYHTLWCEGRGQSKFKNMLAFGNQLSKVRRHIRNMLKKPLLLNKAQVISGIICLLDTVSVRVGSPRYAKQNQSYGITTLRKKHLKLSKKKASLYFKGKNAKTWHIILNDSCLVKLLKKCEDLPGYELFKYYDNAGNISVITAQDVNEYLNHITKEAITAKDFRTWRACKEAIYRMAKTEYCSKNLKLCLADIAELLGHTPAICRSSYIDPDLINAWENGELIKWVKKNNISTRNKDKLFLAWLSHKRSF